MASDQTLSSLRTTKAVLIEPSEKPTPATMPEAAAGAKPRGGKKSTKLPNKKPPQRGLGVEQLERLRVQQENLKKSPHFSHFQPFEPSPFGTEPLESVPVRFGSGGRVPGFPISGGFGCGNPCLMNQQLTVDPHSSYPIGSSFPFGGTETSKELSSLPKLQLVLSCDHCDICSKKQRVNHNVGNDQWLSNPSPRTIDQKASEIMAVHRKENSGGGSVVIEYEFFPGTNGRSGDKEMDLAMEASVSTPTNPIDLSLKL